MLCLPRRQCAPFCGHPWQRCHADAQPDEKIPEHLILFVDALSDPGPQSRQMDGLGWRCLAERRCHGILLRIAGVLHVDAGVVNTVGSAPPWPGRPPWCCQSSKAPSKRNPAGRSPSPPSPEKGCSALVDAAKVVTELERIEYVEDPHLGKGSYCVVERHADGGACSVPDYAVIKLFRHIVQGEGPDTIVRGIDEAIQALPEGYDTVCTDGIFSRGGVAAAVHCTGRSGRPRCAAAG